MTVPDFQTLMLPLLKLAGDGQEHTLSEVVERLAQEFQLSDDDRKELLPSGRQPRFNNRVGWTTTYLKKAGLLRAVGRGRFELTDRGREVLARKPAAIDVNFLESQFPETLSSEGPVQRPRPSTWPKAPGCCAQTWRIGSARRWSAQLELTRFRG